MSTGEPTLKPEQVVEVFTRHFPRTHISKSWIGFAADMWELGVKAQQAALSNQAPAELMAGMTKDQFRYVLQCARAVDEANKQRDEAIAALQSRQPAAPVAPVSTHRHPKRSADEMREIAELEDLAGGVFAAGALVAPVAPVAVVPEFQREERYLVFKQADVSRFLPREQAVGLHALYNLVDVHRLGAGKQPMDCVVVEADWPEYEPTWKAIEARMTGAASPTPPVQPALTVRLTNFPESNGKRNWTAMFVRREPWDGLIGNAGGITIGRGECWNRVAYEAERARCLLGERQSEPDILAYAADVKTPAEWTGCDPEGLTAAQAEGGR